jgi:tetratricopeptide (TPR) repeat protein
LVPATALFVEGACSPSHANSPFFPIVAWFERHHRLALLGPEQKLGVIQATAQELELSPSDVYPLALLLNLADDLEPPSGFSLQQMRQATLSSLRNWLLGSARGQPCVLALEDLQWLDPSTAELIAGFLREPPSTPTMVVVTSRPEFRSPAIDLGVLGFQRIQLERLSRTQARELGALVVKDRDVSDALLDELVLKAEGVPLFIEELLQALVEDRTQRGSRWASRIPSSLRDSLTSRLDRLGQGRQVAQLAAVLGRAFRREHLEAIAAVLGIPASGDLDTEIRRLVSTHLLYEEDAGVFQFKHALIRDAAVDSLARKQLKAFHASIAQTLATRFSAVADGHPEVVAQHYADAELGEPAAACWILAGQKGVAASAYSEAMAHFKAGLDLVPTIAAEDARLKAERDLLAGLGLCYITTRGFAATEVETTYARATQLCEQFGDTPIRVFYGVWAVNLVRGDLPAARTQVPYFERILGSASDEPTRVIAHACLGTWHFFRGNYDEAKQHLAEAKRFCDGGDPKAQHRLFLGEYGFEGLLYGPLYLAWAQALTSERAEALATWADALALAERIGDPYIVTKAKVFGAAIQHDLGDVQAARELADDSMTVSARRGFPFWLALASVISGWALAKQGQPEDGVARIEQGLGILRTIGAKVPYPYYLSYLAEAQVMNGMNEDSLRTVDEALALTEVNIDCNYRPQLLRFRDRLTA